MWMFGVAAEEYHRRAFQRHMDNLQMHAECGDYEGVEREVERFGEQRWVDVAALVMQWTPLVALVCWFATAAIVAGWL